ncbi:MAG: ABC-type transport auxiliary lipoprotein family protein [Nitrospirota bacterium]
MQRVLLIILNIFLISACTMPETKIYSIHIPNPPVPPFSKGGESDASIVIRVHSQRYLTQSYIAYRNSPYQLEISRYSKWESPPCDMVKDAFKDSFSSSGLFKEVRVSNTAPEGFYLLEINLKRFERSDEGVDSFGELVFDVSLLSPDGRELYRNTISKKINLDDKSFLSLARGLSDAIAEGIKEVEDSTIKSIYAP